MFFALSAFFHERYYLGFIHKRAQGAHRNSRFQGRKLVLCVLCVPSWTIFRRVYPQSLPSRRHGAHRKTDGVKGFRLKVAGFRTSDLGPTDYCPPSTVLRLPCPLSPDYCLSAFSLPFCAFCGYLSPAVPASISAFQRFNLSAYSSPLSPV